MFLQLPRVRHHNLQYCPPAAFRRYGISMPQLAQPETAPNRNGSETQPREGSPAHFTFCLAFRRSAQYFFIRSDTALRAAADIVRVRVLVC